jgi:hypothetical protein
MSDLRTGWRSKKRSDQEGQMATWGLFMTTKARKWANSNKLAPQKANSRRKMFKHVLGQPVESISGPDPGLKTPVSKVLRSEAEVNFDEPTQTSAFQNTTKPTTH